MGVPGRYGKSRFVTSETSFRVSHKTGRNRNRTRAGVSMREGGPLRAESDDEQQRSDEDRQIRRSDELSSCMKLRAHLLLEFDIEVGFVQADTAVVMTGLLLRSVKV
jgi:hypothetical protein